MPVPKQYIYLISIIKEQTPKFYQDTFLYSVTKSLKNDGVLLCPILSCFSNCENSCCIDANYETNVAVVKDSIATTFRWLRFHSKGVQNIAATQYVLQNNPNCKMKAKTKLKRI